MNIGIVDVTKSYYFWSGVLEVLCLRTRLIYKFDSARPAAQQRQPAPVSATYHSGPWTAVDQQGQRRQHTTSSKHSNSRRQQHQQQQQQQQHTGLK